MEPVTESQYLGTIMEEKGGHGCESWVLLERLKSKIQTMEMKTLRHIRRVTKCDQITSW